MKTKLLMTMIALVGVITSVQANHRAAELSIDVNSNGRFTAKLDGRGAGYAGRSFSFTDLLPGHHHLKIQRAGNGHAPGNGHHGYVVFDGDVFVPEFSSVAAIIDRRGYFRIVSVSPRIVPAHCGTPAGCLDPYATAPCNYAMTDAEFREFVGIIRSRPFESSRVEVACRMLRDSYLESAQAVELLTEFSFDSDRLEVAKVAYTRTLDRQRFYRVFDTFTFDSNVRELSRFMENYS